MDSVQKTLLYLAAFVLAAITIGHYFACQHEQEMARLGYEQVRSGAFEPILWKKTSTPKAER